MFEKEIEDWAKRVAEEVKNGEADLKITRTSATTAIVRVKSPWEKEWGPAIEVPASSLPMFRADERQIEREQVERDAEAWRRLTELVDRCSDDAGVMFEKCLDGQVVASIFHDLRGSETYESSSHHDVVYSKPRASVAEAFAELVEKVNACER